METVVTLIVIGIFAYLWNAIKGSLQKNREWLEEMRLHDFEWYRDTYPNSFVKEKIHCKACGSKRIHTKSVMQHTYMRVHYCGQCGTNLYHSPERQEAHH